MTDLDVIVLFAVRYALGRLTTSATCTVPQWLIKHADELSPAGRRKLRDEISDELGLWHRVAGLGPPSPDARHQWETALRMLAERV